MAEEMKTKSTEAMTDGLIEARLLIKLLEEARFKGYEIDFEEGQYLFLIAGVINKKLKYFQKKYNFRIENDDIVFLEDLASYITFPVGQDEATEEEVSADE